MRLAFFDVSTSLSLIKQFHTPVTHSSKHLQTTKNKVPKSDITFFPGDHVPSTICDSGTFILIGE